MRDLILHEVNCDKNPDNNKVDTRKAATDVADKLSQPSSGGGKSLDLSQKLSQLSVDDTKSQVHHSPEVDMEEDARSGAESADVAMGETAPSKRKASQKRG